MTIPPLESICYTCGYKVREEKCMDTFIPRDGRESSACNLSRQSKYDLCRKYRDGWTVMCNRNGNFLMCGEKCYTGHATSTKYSLFLVSTVAFVHLTNLAARLFS
ncbi:hypothetical protein LOTGIDRAFT_167537 [Lottia gigantea]|uniref:Uncharacterized protein n=1 Tax=Lottia gigantea TaxID=225164 RepID=V3ZNY7_LOTGI|nr:hypothetical protein LOTGIDRAFT_167537 [Lottia gigantea]ESO86032.1 hypothetical protein LOTGIDRAFT_167537 [Lottia gigantea]